MGRAEVRPEILSCAFVGARDARARGWKRRSRERSECGTPGGGRARVQGGAARGRSTESQRGAGGATAAEMKRAQLVWCEVRGLPRGRRPGSRL